MLCTMSDADTRAPCCKDMASVLNIGGTVKEHHVHYTLMIAVPVFFYLDPLNQGEHYSSNVGCVFLLP